MFEFLKSNLEYIYEIIAESLLVFIKPRKYLLLIAKESTQASIKRVSTITILYILITISLASVFYPERINISYLQLIGIGFIEILLAVLAIIPLLSIKFIFEKKISFRQMIVFLLTAKFILIPLIMLPYLLFLKTEDYTFVLFRAFIIYFYVIFVLIILPTINNYKVWRRILSIIVLFLAMSIIGQIIIFFFSFYNLETTYHQIKKNILLYDPIGNECFSIVKKVGEYDSLGNLSHFAHNYFKSFNVIEKDSVVILSMQRSIHDSIFQGWNKKFNDHKHRLFSLKNFIDSCDANLRYKTSKNLISNMNEVVLSQQSLVESLDSLSRSIKLNNYQEFYSNLSITMDKEISFLKIEEEILRNLVQLRKYLIIII